MDSLQLVKVEKWNELQKEFENDYPRGITGYNVLEMQKKIFDQGLKYDFKVLCPFGEAKNGMVAVLNEQENYLFEVQIECPTDDTSELEEALKTTKYINWDREIRILFAPLHVLDCIKRVVKTIGREITHLSPLNYYLLDKSTPLFDVSLPPTFSFQSLSKEYAELVDSKWPHRRPGSITYFNRVIEAKTGYGLFKDQELIAFCFVKETGAVGHLYTQEDHTRKGYGDIILKLLCNIILKDGRHVNSYCLEGNVAGNKMHKRFGFKKAGEVVSTYIN